MQLAVKSIFRTSIENLWLVAGPVGIIFAVTYLFIFSISADFRQMLISQKEGALGAVFYFGISFFSLLLVFRNIASGIAISRETVRYSDRPVLTLISWIVSFFVAVVFGVMGVGKWP